MRERLHIPIPIVVEGVYDKHTLSQLVDATIVTTEGFGVFRRPDKQAFFRRLAERHGIIVLTDADGGGRQIRSFLLGILPKERVISLHIPKTEGKERRKRRPSRSGLVGVEGMRPEVLLDLLRPFADGAPARPPEEPLTTAELFADGLTGTPDAAERRRTLAIRLGLPDDLSTAALVQAIELLVGREGYRRAVRELFGEEGKN